MKKNIFFLIIIVAFLIQIDVALGELDCLDKEYENNKIYTNCYEIKTDQYNSTTPKINVTFHEEVTITDYELMRIDDLDFNLTELDEEEYFEQGNDYSDYGLEEIEPGQFQPTQILSDGLYAFNISAFNLPNIYINSMVFFKINASQMNFWVESPAHHSIEKPDFAASKTQTNNITLKTERPVEGCKYSFNLGTQTAQNLYENTMSEEFELTDDNTRLKLENFNFQEGYTVNSTHGFRKLDVICKEEQQGDSPARYSYKQLYFVAQTTPPTITTKPLPETVRSYSNPYSNLNITTQQTTTCTLNVPQLSDEVDDTASNPTFPYDNEYVFDDLSYYQKDEEQRINFSHKPSPHEFLFNVTCTNLAGRESSTTQQINTDFDISTEFDFREPKKFTTKTMNVSGEYTQQDANCQATFNDDDKTHKLDSKGTASTGKEIYQDEISTSLDEGKHEVHVTCDGMPENYKSTKTFTIDTTAPTNMEIETPENSCSFKEIKGKITAEDENEIDHFEYKAEYTGSEDVEFEEEGRTSKSFTIKLPSSAELLLENDTIELQARAIDRAGNTNDWITKNIKITHSDMIECDFSDPLIRIKEDYNKDLSRWDVNVSCADDNECDPTFYWGHETNKSETCTAEQTASLQETIPIKEPGTFCATVYDLNNNNASSSIKLEYGEGCAGRCGGECEPCEVGDTCETNSDCVSNYCVEGICEQASCEDGEKNGLETDIDCGGDCEPCEINASCSTHSDCQTKNCIQGLCTEASCENDRIDGTETDVDCGGGNCTPCELGSKCLSDSDCAQGECIDNECAIPQEESEEDESQSETQEESNIIGLILLITGLISIIAGSVLLYLEQEKKKTQKQTEDVNKTRASLNAGMPKVSTLGTQDEKTPIQKLSPEDAEKRRKAWLNSVKEKDEKRKETLSAFDEETEIKKQEEVKDQTQSNNQKQTINQTQPQQTTTSQTQKTQSEPTQEKTQTTKDETIDENSQSQEFVELDTLNKEKDAFEQLKQKTTTKKTDTKTTNKTTKKTDNTPTKKTENKPTKKATTKKTTKKEDEDFFEKLKEMNEKNKNKTKKTNTAKNTRTTKK